MFLTGSCQRAEWRSIAAQVPSDLTGYIERLASMRTSLEALRPRLPSLGNVLPWGRGTANDAPSMPEIVAVD